MAFVRRMIWRCAGGCVVLASRRVLDTSPHPCRMSRERQRDMMRSRRYRIVVAAVVAAMAVMVGAGAAQAVFPNFTGCTSRTPETGVCVNIQQRSGNLRIGGFNVPLHETLEVR